MTIYEKLIEEVQKGRRFNVNFASKSIRVDKTYLLKNGIHFGAELIQPTENVWEELEDLYEEYKYSCPTEKKLGNKPYFKALEYEEMNDEDLAFGENRNEAQAKLEAYILLHALAGDLTIEYGWFWQSTRDKDFIILKDWIE